MKRRNLLVSALLMLLAIGTSRGGAVVQDEKEQPASRPTTLTAALVAALDVERLSQAYYRAVLDKHRPLHPFGIVYRAERRHEQVLVDELRKQGIAVPENTRRAQDAEVPDEKSKALARAVELEKQTVRAYDDAIRLTSAGDLRQTLERLRGESVEHQRWFEDPGSCPADGGGKGDGGRRRGRP